jgi:putative transcriptional regulator
MATDNLNGKLLIASLNVKNKLFQKSVIYLHTDDDTGSVGFMLNMRMENELAIRWSQEIDWHFPDRIQSGGPVDRQLGYIIHSSDYARESSVILNNNLIYTGGHRIIDDINRSIGPANFILLTGYCIWNPTQLNLEIENKMWSVVDFDKDLFFKNLNKTQYWDHAIAVSAANKTSQLLNMIDNR